MICQTCQGDGRRLNPGLSVIEHDGRTTVHNPCSLPVLVECPECRGSGAANDNGCGERLRLTIEDVDGLIREIWSMQPVHPRKRITLLDRLYRVRHNLEHLRNT